MPDIYPPESKRDKRVVPSPQPPQPSNKPRSPSDGRLSRNKTQPKGK